MSASAQLGSSATRITGEGDDFSCPLALPFPDSSRPSGSALDVNVNWHGEAERPHGDIHSTVPNVVFGNLIQKHWQATWHDHAPSSLKTERVGVGPLSFDSIKAHFAYRTIITGPFLPTVLGERPTAVINQPLGQAA